jgi:hypothetical protein
MTTRNLNRTWRDVVFAQYKEDHDADLPFPVRYLITAREWKKDIWIEVPSKIEVRAFQTAVLNFCRMRRHNDPIYQGQHISVRPRVSYSERRAQEDSDDTNAQEDNDYSIPEQDEELEDGEEQQENNNITVQPSYNEHTIPEEDEEDEETSLPNGVHSTG